MSDCKKVKSLDGYKTVADINSLPDEVLVCLLSKIPFADLCRCARVCRRWRDLVKSSLKPKQIILHDTLTSSQLSSLMKRYFTQDLQDFQIHRYKQAKAFMSVSKEKLQKIVDTCVNLKTLGFMSCSLISVTLRDFPSTLTHLSLRHSEMDVRYFFQPNPSLYLPNLVSLDIGCLCDFVASQDLPPFNHLKNLRELYMEGCFRINNGGIESLDGILPQLEILDVEGTDVSNDGIVFIMKHCPNMQELYIGNNKLNNGIFKSVNKDLIPKLKTLCVKNTDITATCLDEYFKGHPDCKNLIINANPKGVNVFTSKDKKYSIECLGRGELFFEYGSMVERCWHYISKICSKPRPKC